MSLLTQPLLGLPPALQQQHAAESRATLVWCCLMSGNLRTSLVCGKSSLLHEKGAVPQKPVSSRLKFVSGYVVTGGTLRGIACGDKSSSPVGRSALSLSPERRAAFSPCGPLPGFAILRGGLISYLTPVSLACCCAGVKGLRGHSRSEVS